MVSNKINLELKITIALSSILILLLVPSLQGSFAEETGESYSLKQETKVKLDEALLLRENSQIIQALIKSNSEFDAMNEPYIVIDKRNDDWVKAGKKVTPFMGSLIGNKVSELLRNIILEDKEKTQDFTYEEIFITNAFGANVAQTGKTSDYKQWDEQWWLQAKRSGVYFQSGYDESAGVYALDISVRITDDNENFLGIMKFVINIENLSTYEDTK